MVEINENPTKMYTIPKTAFRRSILMYQLIQTPSVEGVCGEVCPFPLVVLLAKDLGDLRDETVGKFVIFVEEIVCKILGILQLK